MAGGIASRVDEWARRRAFKDAEGGRLVYVVAPGQVVDLGAFTPDELEALAWAQRVAYRGTRDRGERSRLAQVRGAAQRLGVGASKVRASSSSSLEVGRVGEVGEGSSSSPKG